MHKIEDKITQVNTRIEKAALAANRNPREITLLAVSKRQTDAQLIAAYQAGLRHFGENYVQEAIAKKERLNLTGAIWHFIGPIQSNKTKSIAEHFSWVHSVDRLKIAQRLNDQRRNELPPLNICLQINIDEESTKSGIAAENIDTLAAAVNQLPNLRLRGLMAIPQPAIHSEQSLAAFKNMKSLFDRLKNTPALANMDTLSMGMSVDIEAAIQQGSTLVRVGTALFGPRAKIINNNSRIIK